MTIRLAVVAALLALGGCLTVSQSEYPAVQLTGAPKGAPTVALAGFEAQITTYVPVSSYSTVWQSTGYYHHGHYHRGWDYPQTVSTTTYVAQRENMTGYYVEKARDLLEKADYVVSVTNAAHVVEVHFSGPAVTDGDRTAEFASMLFTAFLADRTSAAWSARLKITETASGRVVFSHDYEQEYVAWSVGLVPIFSPLSAETVQADYIQNWCLSALTDRAIADATAFLSGAETSEKK